MIFRLIFLMVLLWSSVLAFSQDANALNLDRLLEVVQKDSGNADALKNLSLIYLHKADYYRAIYYAEQLKKLGNKENNNSYRLYAYIGLGQALMMKGYALEAKEYMSKSLKLALQLHNDSALCSVYNGLGLYAANIESDYYRSINYFFKGIEVAKRISNDQLYSIMLTNLAGMYYLKQDPEGLKYALECYRLGQIRSDSYLIYSGATNTAYMYYLKKDYTAALKYLKEAEHTMTSKGFLNQSNVYNLYGNIEFALKSNARAVFYFNKALKMKANAQTSSIVDTYLSYARLLMSEQKYQKAVDLLLKGLELSRVKINFIHRNDLYEYISVCYEKLHQYEDALKYYKAFTKENDSIFNVDKERSVNELMVRYGVEKQMNEIKQNKLELLEKEKKVQLQMFIIVFVVLILLLMYYQYRRKNKLYIQIVKQNMEAVNREKYLDLQIKQLKESTLKDTGGGTGKYSVSSLTDEKSIKLYRLVEHTMREKKVYKDNYITKEKLADMLETNRTYLSQVINEQSGLSFTHYINKFRIEEAVRRLSDLNDHTPLKALSSELGFNSITTFYNVFQSIVGLTPSSYRTKVTELQKNS